MDLRKSFSLILSYTCSIVQTFVNVHLNIFKKVQNISSRDFMNIYKIHELKHISYKYLYSSLLFKK